MILAGKILDKVTLQPVPGASVTIVTPGGTYANAGTSANSQGVYYLNSDKAEPPNWARFTSAGYKMAQIELYDNINIDWNGTVLLDKSVITLPPVVVTSNKNKSLLLLAAGAGILLLASEKEKEKSVGKIDRGDIVTFGIGLLLLKGFGLLEKLLHSLGIGDSSGAGAQESDPLAPWNPSYWHNNADTATAGAFGIFHSSYVNKASAIYHAFGVFQDNYNAVKAVFDSLHSKSGVSYLADVFNQEYGDSLLSFLRDGGGIMPWDGLSNDHMTIIINYVKNLPTT